MTYEEEIFKGVLMFRHNRHSAWQQCSIEKMSERIINLELSIKEAKEAGYMEGKRYVQGRMRCLLGLED